MTTTASVAYGTSTAMTITLTSLASSSTLVAGRESTVVDNTGTLAIDYLVGGKIRAGAGTPIAGQIEVWAAGSYDGTTFAGIVGAGDAALTLTNEKPRMSLLDIIAVDTTASHTYEFGPKSIAQAFGGVVPKKWGVFVTHNMSATLSATAADHEIKYTAINFTSA